MAEKYWRWIVVIAAQQTTGNAAELYTQKWFKNDKNVMLNIIKEKI